MLWIFNTVPAYIIYAIFGLVTLYLLEKLTENSASSPFRPKEKHCFVTGASQGLGLELAKKLAKRGAHLTLVARNPEKLASALEQVQSLCGPEQQVRVISADLTNYEQCRSAFQQASERIPPHYIFCCAGSSQPGFWLDHPDESLINEQMNRNFFVAAYTAHAGLACLKAKGDLKGTKLVLVGSILGAIGLVGYTQYACAKYAIKGLADSLRNELLLYGVDVHVFLPGTMFTPGYESENLTKPQLTKDIEGTDGVTPEHAANSLLNGLARGHYTIASDLVGNLVTSASCPLTPGRGVVTTNLERLVTALFLPFYRMYVDRTVRSAGNDL